MSESQARSADDCPRFAEGEVDAVSLHPLLEGKYPGYNVADGRDIAHLELTDPLPDPFARLSLSAATDPSDVLPMRSMVAGFGRTVPNGQALGTFPTARGGTGFAMSDVLRETTVPTARKGRCKAGGSEICTAKAQYGGCDSCDGDSGGPLVLFDRDRYPYGVGLTSYGPRRCGIAHSFGIYTRVSTYAAWIRRYVPSVATPPTPIDRTAIKKAFENVWASLNEIENKAASLPPQQRAALALCKRDGPGCEPRGEGPLLDAQRFRVEASAPSKCIVIVAVSA